MNTAEWILVVILSVTLFIFLIVGIVLIVKLIGVSKEVEKVVVKSQDIASNTNEIVSNVKGMTAFGSTVQMVVDKFVNPKIKSKIVDEEPAKEAAEESKTEKTTKTTKTTNTTKSASKK